MPTIAQGSDEMESKIDWSKAPEDATHYNHACFDWYKVGSHEPFFWNGRAWAPARFWDDRKHDCIQRPTTPSWSGEGLPPVGVVCEYRCVNDKWRQVKVIAHMIEMQKDNPCAVSQLGDTGPLCIGGASSFRPIRTIEQIEADQREAQIVAIHDAIVTSVKVTLGQCDSWRKVAEMVYDAGFKRPE